MAISTSLENGMFVVICLVLAQTWGDPANAVDLVVVVMSQSNTYQASLAENVRADILAQALQQGIEGPTVYLTHKDFADIKGSWTYLPIIQRLGGHKLENSSWVFFCEDRTKIYLQQLRHLLSEYDPEQGIWIGYGLQDKEPTIIHHFTDAPNFKYPHFGVGFAISVALIKRIANRLDGYSATDFSIDPSYELAQYIHTLANGVELTHSAQLCVEEAPLCATVYLPFEPCNASVPIEAIHFAVKTCEKFHIDRVPVVKSTWALAAESSIAFYSDFKDSTIPTVDLGVPNTLHGHCGKTTAILRHVAKRKDLQWLVIADDDTLLSVWRLRQLLACFHPHEPISVGERYGYDLAGPQGYDYLTGGGGIALSMPAVRTLAESCRCQRNSSPDDMFLGFCMARLNLTLVHSPLFHQARPSDYAASLLSVQRAISFHKHWMIDPLATYREWLFDRPDKVAAHSEL